MPVKVLHLRFKGADRKFPVAVDANNIPIVYRYFFADTRKLYSFQCGGEDRSSGSVDVQAKLRGMQQRDWVISLDEE